MTRHRNPPVTAPGSDSERRRRSIRSFVLREGRITRAQQQALDSLWPQFGVEYQNASLAPEELFDQKAPLTIEIGFGNGEALSAIAQAQPDCNFLGIKVHRPGVGQLLIQTEKLGLKNVRVIAHDAVEVLQNMLTKQSLNRVNIYFPDPWPKKRHHKRRLIQTPFVDLLADRLEPDGLLHLATDWEPYAEHMLEVLTCNAYFDNTAAGNTLKDGCIDRPESRPLTKFERRGHRRGHGVWDLVFKRNLASI